MDPLNQYNSKPNTAPAYQPLKSQGLMSAPNGQQTLGTINIGGAGGGRSYVPNQFQNPMPQNNVPGLTAPMGGKNGALPAGPVKAPVGNMGNMGFGSGGTQQLWQNVAQQFANQGQQQPIQGNMQRMGGYNPLQNSQLGGVWNNVANQFANQSQMQNQMLQASAVRNGGRVM